MKDSILSRTMAYIIKTASVGKPDGSTFHFPINSNADRDYVYSVISELRKSGYEATPDWTSHSMVKIHTKMSTPSVQ